MENSFELENCLKTILDTSLDIVVVIDPDGTILYINEQAAAPLKKPADHLIGDNLWECFPPDAAERRRIEIQKAVETKEPVRYEDRGESNWYDIVIYPVVDGDKKITRLVTWGRDITGYKKAELALKKERDFAEGLIETARAIVLVLDPEGKIVRFNSFLEEIAGYKLSEVVGKDWISSFIPERIRDEIRGGFQKAIGNSQTKGYINPIMTKSGKERIIEWYDKTILDTDGNVTGLLAIGLDITTRIKAQEEIRKFNEELENHVRQRTLDLEAANQELEAFSYSVSHDLRAPIRRINSFCKILQAEHQFQLTAKGREYLDFIRQTTHMMGGLIENLLKLSRISRSEITFHRVDLSAMVQQLLHAMQQADPERKVKLKIQKNLEVEGDLHLLKILLQNLLDNAWKFSENRSTSKISFGCNRKSGRKVYFIKDNGVGFDMQYVNKLFLPFQRLHDSGQFPGTGVGLAIVKRIIKRHGGEIWIEGEPDAGTTVNFTLPDRKNHNSVSGSMTES